MEQSRPEHRTEAAARETLERLRHEGGLFTGMLRRSVAPATAADHDDPIERWGGRIGRSLAVIVAFGCFAYFVLRHVQ